MHFGLKFKYQRFVNYLLILQMQITTFKQIFEYLITIYIRVGVISA